MLVLNLFLNKIPTSFDLTDEQLLKIRLVMAYLKFNVDVLLGRLEQAPGSIR
jgi:hypothetical protein